MFSTQHMRICTGFLFLTGVALLAQEPAVAPESYTVTPGTRIALGLVNSVSTKHSVSGDRIYLETVFPIVLNSHIVIPAGSYVTGTVTGIRKPGRVKGRAEMYVRFDTLTLPNGVTREFRSRLGSIDARGDEKLDDKEGIVRGDSNRGGDARTIAEAAAAGAGVGVIAGSANDTAGTGLGIGSAAGAAAGLIGVLLSRGPDAELARGSTVEMVLDRPLLFTAKETDFSGAPMAPRMSDGPGPRPKNAATGISRFPI
jgi:type IV secretion system protein VirB10